MSGSTCLFSSNLASLVSFAVAMGAVRYGSVATMLILRYLFCSKTSQTSRIISNLYLIFQFNVQKIMILLSTLSIFTQYIEQIDNCITSSF